MSDPSPDPSREAGLLVVDKPGGMTSHDVVARVRRLAGTRKVGHAGTLDPIATGVLVVGLNRATRLLGHLQAREKAYEATIRLGVTTSTDDAEGEVLAERDPSGVDAEEVRARLAAMTGEVEQRPAAVSAIKVGGRRAYDLVRSGEEVDLPTRRVRIDSLEVERMALPDLEVRVRCSSGTYVRAVARDLGEALGVGGHLTALRRTSVGPLDLAEAVTLADLEQRVRPLPIAEVARRCFDCRDLDEAAATDVRHGRPLDLAVEGPTAVFSPEGDFLALYGPDGPERARAVAVFV